MFVYVLHRTALSESNNNLPWASQEIMYCLNYIGYEKSTSSVYYAQVHNIGNKWLLSLSSSYGKVLLQGGKGRGNRAGLGWPFWNYSVPQLWWDYQEQPFLTPVVYLVSQSGHQMPDFCLMSTSLLRSQFIEGRELDLLVPPLPGIKCFVSFWVFSGISYPFLTLPISPHVLNPSLLARSTLRDTLDVK